MRRIASVLLLGWVLTAGLAEAGPKKPSRAAALQAAKALVDELVAAEAGGDEARDPKLAPLVSTTRFTVVVGYERADEDGAGCPGACTCEATVTDPAMLGWAARCLTRNAISFAPTDDQWGDWSKKAMKKWTWQIDGSGLAKLARRARLLVLRAPETIYVFAVVTDDDGAARVAAVYSGMTYD